MMEVIQRGISVPLNQVDAAIDVLDGRYVLSDFEIAYSNNRGIIPVNNPDAALSLLVNRVDDPSSVVHSFLTKYRSDKNYNDIEDHQSKSFFRTCYKCGEVHKGDAMGLMAFGIVFSIFIFAGPIGLLPILTCWGLGILTARGKMHWDQDGDHDFYE